MGTIIAGASGEASAKGSKPKSKPVTPAAAADGQGTPAPTKNPSEELVESVPFRLCTGVVYGLAALPIGKPGK
eukprot:5852880-Pyramimonas_sp.AAC.1